MKKVISVLCLGAVLLITGCSSSSNESEFKRSDVTSVSVVENTPVDQLSDLQIGESVCIYGCTVTVNDIRKTADDECEIDVTYVNNSCKSVSVTAYDWSAITSSDYELSWTIDNDFKTERVANGETLSGTVTLHLNSYNDFARRIKFESSSLNLLKDEDLCATWLIPDDIISEINTTTTECTEDVNHYVTTKIQTEYVVTEKVTTMPDVVTITTTETTTIAYDTESNAVVTEDATPAEFTYILNTNSMVFHKSSCGSVKQIKDSNRGEYYETRDDVISQGYKPCGKCKP